MTVSEIGEAANDLILAVEACTGYRGITLSVEVDRVVFNALRKSAALMATASLVSPGTFEDFFVLNGVRFQPRKEPR